MGRVDNELESKSPKSQHCYHTSHVRMFSFTENIMLVQYLLCIFIFLRAWRVPWSF